VEKEEIVCLSPGNFLTAKGGLEFDWLADEWAQ